MRTSNAFSKRFLLLLSRAKFLSSCIEYVGAAVVGEVVDDVDREGLTLLNAPFTTCILVPTRASIAINPRCEEDWQQRTRTSTPTRRKSSPSSASRSSFDEDFCVVERSPSTKLPQNAFYTPQRQELSSGPLFVS